MRFASTGALSGRERGEATMENRFATQLLQMRQQAQFTVNLRADFWWWLNASAKRYAQCDAVQFPRSDSTSD